MKPRLTTIAVTALAISSGALAQLEPLTCDGPGATHDCRTLLAPLDALAAAHATPHNPIQAAHLLHEQGAAVEARTELMQALTSTPPEERADLFFLLGLVEARLGAYDAAASAFATVRPSTFASRYNEALARAHAGDHASAQTALQELITKTLEAHHGVSSLEELPPDTTLTPTAQEAINLLLTTSATLHYMNQTPADAVTTLQQLLKLTPRTPQLTLLEVSAAIDFLPGDGSVTYTQRHAQDHNRNLLLGRAYARAGMREYARQHYQAATPEAITTRNPHALTEIAAYHAHNHEWPQAGRAATEALRHDPTNHHARTYLGLALEQQEQHAEAATEYQLALTHGADPIRTNTRLAFARAHAHEHQAAIAAAEAALHAADAHPSTTDNNGKLEPEAQYALLTLLTASHYALGELPEALAYAVAATRHPLATPDMHAFAADLHLQAGDPQAAIEQYARADQTDPQTARAAYHAHLQLEQHELARQAATRLTSAPGEALHLIAWAYALEGDTRAALRAWERAAQAEYQPAKQVLERIQ